MFMQSKVTIEQVDRYLNNVGLQVREGFDAPLHFSFKWGSKSF